MFAKVGSGSCCVSCGLDSTFGKNTVFILFSCSFSVVINEINIMDILKLFRCCRICQYVNFFPNLPLSKKFLQRIFSFFLTFSKISLTTVKSDFFSEIDLNLPKVKISVTLMIGIRNFILFSQFYCNERFIFWIGLPNCLVISDCTTS